MKKNISINISGIIFHIEEDGYERLKAYLESINRYFSTFEDSEEIIADIESRIAEIFLSRLKEGKQVISLEDVDQLMTTMGSIRDFQTLEDVLEDEKTRPAGEKAYSAKEEKTQQDTSDTGAYKAKRLYRDESRKVVGGVAAGIAHYFGIEPLWVRLLFAILLLDMFVSNSISTLLFISYLIAWILIPGSRTLEQDKKIKRLYRDPDDRIVGGVSSGLAAYFGTDPLLIRVIFILLLIFGGTAIPLYIVLWIIMPPARTLTEKMQMQGEPVTLSNIEQNIKKSLNVQEGEENLLVKIILFPFRFIATVFRGAGSMAGPLLLFLGDLLRIILGVILVLLGISFFLVAISTLAIIGGVGNLSIVSIDGIELELLLNSIPTVSLVATFVLNFVLSILIMIGGLMLITKKSLLNPLLGWTLLAALVVSLVILGISTTTTVRDFARTSSVVTTRAFNIAEGTTTLRLGSHPSNRHEVVDLRIKPYEGDKIRLEEEAKAKGRNTEVAEENARMITYRAEMKDSVLTLDRSFAYRDDAVFRNQQLDLTLYIPYNVPFILENDVLRILDWNASSFRTYTDETVMFDSVGNLECLSCPEPRAAEPDSVEWEAISGGEEVSLSDFRRIEAAGGFTIRVVESDDYKAEISGARANQVSLDVRDNELEIDFGGTVRLKDNDITEQITILLHVEEPIEGLELRDKVKMKLEDVRQEQLRVTLEGESALSVSGRIDHLEAELSSSSLLTLSGDGEDMEVDQSGGSRLQAAEFDVREAKIEASGSSEASLNVSRKLNAEASGDSQILYTGDCTVDAESYGSASIRKN